MKNKLTLSRLLLDLSSLIYLPISILSIFCFLLKPRYQSVFFVSLTFSGFAFLLIPYNVWDLARHYESFLTISNMPFSELLEYGHIRYLPLHVYMWFIASIGLPKEVLPAISIFFSYITLLTILVNIHESKRLTDFQFLILTISIWCAVPFIGIASSLRQHLAIIIFIYGMWNYVLKNKSKYLLYFFVALLIHSSVIVLLIVMFACKLKINDNIKRFSSILFILLMISGLSSDLFFSVINVFKDILVESGFYFAVYFDKSIIMESIDSLSKFEYLVKFIVNPMLFYCVAFSYAFYCKASSKEEMLINNFLYLLLLTIFIVSPSETIFSRFSFAFTVIGILYIFNYNIFQYSVVKRTLLYFFLLLSITITTLVKTNAYKLVIIPSWSRVLYTPSVFFPIYSKEDIDSIKVE